MLTRKQHVLKQDPPYNMHWRGTQSLRISWKHIALTWGQYPTDTSVVVTNYCCESVTISQHPFPGSECWLLFGSNKLLWKRAVRISLMFLWTILNVSLSWMISVHVQEKAETLDDMHRRKWGLHDRFNCSERTEISRRCELHAHMIILWSTR